MRTDKAGKFLGLSFNNVPVVSKQRNPIGPSTILYFSKLVHSVLEDPPLTIDKTSGFCLMLFGFSNEGQHHFHDSDWFNFRTNLSAFTTVISS